jgi:hypothetical protein
MSPENTIMPTPKTDARRQPCDASEPNAATRQAMAELAAGKGERFDSVAALMADLHADSIDLPVCSL